MSQIEDMPLPLTKLGQNARHFRFNLRRSTIEHGRIHIALQCHLVTDPGSGIRYGGTPVQSQGIAASGRHHLEPLSPPLGKEGDRHSLTILHPHQPLDDLLHIGQGEGLICWRREHSAPGIKDHHGLGSSRNLGIEIEDHALGQLAKQGMQSLWLPNHHLLDLAKALAATPFHHVSGQRPGTPREADQRHSTIQRLANGTHRRHNVAQFSFWIRNG